MLDRFQKAIPTLAEANGSFYCGMNHGEIRANRVKKGVVVCDNCASSRSVLRRMHFSPPRLDFSLQSPIR